jgi:hypothetical protein
MTKHLGPEVRTWDKYKHQYYTHLMVTVADYSARKLSVKVTIPAITVFIIIVIIIIIMIEIRYVSVFWVHPR